MAKVEVKGTWVDDITQHVKATTNTLKQEFSVANAAQVALAGVTGVTLTGAFAALAAQGEHLAKVYIELERNNTRLSSALRITGQYTADNFKAMKELADAAESQAGFLFDDQDILRAETYALTVGRIATRDMPEMVKAAANLAAVLNTDLGTGMEAIVKGGFGIERQLKQVGLQFTATGKQAEDMKNIAAAVNKQFEDAAANGLGPFERKLAEMKDQIEDTDKALAANGKGWKTWSENIKNSLSEAAAYWMLPENDYLRIYGTKIGTPPNINAKGGGLSFMFSGGNAPAWAGAAQSGMTWGGGPFAPPAWPPVGVPRPDAAPALSGSDWWSTYGWRNPVLGAPPVSGLRPYRGAPDPQPDLDRLQRNLPEVVDPWERRAKAEAAALEQAKVKSEAFTHTLLNGLSQIELQGKVTFRNVAALLIQLVDAVAHRDVANLFTGLFNSGVPGDSTTDLARGRDAGD